MNDDNNNIIRNLLSFTANNPHGQFPECQEDDNGNVWEFIWCVGEKDAEQLLQHMFPDMQTWLPGDREYHIIAADNTHIYAMYRVLSRFHIIRAVGARYYQTQLRKYSGRAAVSLVVDASLKQMYSHQAYTDYHV